jgi:hypothetical protein
MSLFDVIRYPISMPPTEAEILALPNSLFKRWTESSKEWSDSPTQSFVAYWYSAVRNETQIQDIKLLRQMIKDY